MKDIKVLGSGCAKCEKTIAVIDTVARELNVAVTITKETSPESIMSYGVMSTPAVVIDNTVVHAGSIPHRDKIEQWLKNSE